MRRKYATVLGSTVFSLSDVGLSTVAFSHGTEFHEHFTVDVQHYTFQDSLFDLWIMSLLRSVILLGAVFAIICNPLDSLQRISKAKPYILVLSVLMWSFNITKLMVISEDVSNLKQPWLWVMVVWSAVASVILSVDWILLRNINQSVTSNKSHDLNINSKSDERRPLISSNGSASSSNQANVSNEHSEKEEKDKKVSKATLFRLLSYSKPDWFIITLAFMFLTASAVGLVIDGIVIDKSQTKFISAIVIMGLISLGSAITAGLRGGLFVLAISRLNIRLRNLLFSSIVHQEIGFFDEVRTGDITSRLTSDITTMSDTLGLNINVFLRSTIKAAGVIFFMVKLSLRLTGVTVVAMPIIVGVSKIYGKYYKKLSKAVQDSLAVANDVAEEVCSSMRTVRSFANEDGEQQRYKTSLAETYKLQKKQAVVYAGYSWCTQIFDLSLSVTVLYYGGHLVVTNRMTGGNLVSFILYQLELGNCIQSMGAVYTGLMQAAGASEKVFEYIDRKPRFSNIGTQSPDKLEGRLDFNNVTFSYPARPDAVVLKDLTFSVKPGEVVALVGPSGGGKSSCVNLLEHFYECESGQILLDGRPIQRYDHKYLHRKIALVGQEPVLYARSIWDNIAYGAEEYPEASVTQAANMANAHRFITELPEGYETKTGEKGLQLSGGQKQRIAIARALIRDPTILILDEATSALDAESEHIVQKAIYKNLQGRTVIIVAHRLSTVERADRILVIDKGVIIQQGKHVELLHQEGLYAKLVQRQLLGFDLGLERTDSADGGRGPADRRQKCACKCTCDSRLPKTSNTSAGSYGSVNLLQVHTDEGSPEQSPPQVTFRIGSQ